MRRTSCRNEHLKSELSMRWKGSCINTIQCTLDHPWEVDFNYSVLVTLTPCVSEDDAASNILRIRVFSLFFLMIGGGARIHE